MEAYVILFALLGLAICFPLALMSAGRHSEATYEQIGRTKRGTILAILVSGGVGGLYYLLRIRPDLRAASAA